MTQSSHRSALPRIFWAVWEKLWWLFGIAFIGGVFLIGTKDPALLFRLFGLLFILVGFTMLIYVEIKRRQQIKSQYWMPVQGRIIFSEVEREILRSTYRSSPMSGGDIPTYFPRVEYSYEYQGKAYQGRGIINISINWPRKEAETAVARYPVDAAVTVWVNPVNPHQAVLETGMERYAKKYRMAFVICIAFLVIGVAGWLCAPLMND